MITLTEKYIIVETDKVYSIPVSEINDFVNNDEFLLNITLKELLQVFIYGVPENIKELLLKKVSLYDSSSEVNSFIYKDKEYWFDKNTRASLVNLANFTEDIFTLILGDLEVKIPVEKAKEFLAKLESYAQKCFINTNKHLKAVNNIPTPKNKDEVKNYIDSIINYDYTTGYPDKIILE